MATLSTYELFSTGLVCLFALLMRLGAYVNKMRETKDRKFQLTGWKVIYHAAATFGLGMLAAHMLKDLEWGSGMKMGATFFVAFISTVIVDAFMQIDGRMVLNAFAKWVAAKTGTDISNQNDYSKPQEGQEDEG